MLNLFRRVKRLGWLVVITMGVMSIPSISIASIVSTESLVQARQSQLDRQQLIATLSREDVRQQIVGYGVEPAEAVKRVAAMTDTEVAQLNHRIDAMQAGAGILDLAVLVFIILLVTDILGYTDIFPFVKKK